MTRLSCYRAYSLNIGSELPLPTLPPADGEPDILIRLGTVSRTAQTASLHDEVVIHGLAGAFHISNGSQVVVDPLPDASPEVVRVVLLGRIMAYLLRQRGWLALHASGVVLNGSAVLFLGSSGAGKSTLAAAHHAAGYHIFTDDVAPVQVSEGRCTAMLVRQTLRLDDQSRSLVEAASAVFEWDKYRVDLTRGPLPEFVPVRHIFELADGDGDDIVSMPIPPSDAVRYLSANSMVRHRRMDEASVRAHLRDCAAVAAVTSVSRLIRPRRINVLPDVVRSVERITL